ncbi:metallopeptidase family protein [Candidatus Saccharibacteria bacterium]|nr:metallopeptidase family protein [Candidatus Saccharibacteria bacterium]
MHEVSDDEFSKLIAELMDELPKEYISGLKNVLITYEDEPSADQLNKQKLAPYQTLFGLYEGVPLTNRGAGYQLVLPDRITIFKKPILNNSADLKTFRAQVKHTLWHEIAHYYGLNHERIHEIEKNWH